MAVRKSQEPDVGAPRMKGDSAPELGDAATRRPAGNGPAMTQRQEPRVPHVRRKGQGTSGKGVRNAEGMEHRPCGETEGAIRSRRQEAGRDLEAFHRGVKDTRLPCIWK